MGLVSFVSRSGGHKTKETYPTRPGFPTQCKQSLSEPIAFLSFAEILSKGAWKTVEASSSLVSPR